MKVLRVIDSMDPKLGGPSQGIRNSIPGLQLQGIQNDVVCLDNINEPFIGEDPFKVIPLGPKKGPWHYSNRLLPWLLENMQNYDIVIIHGLWLYHGYAVNKAISKVRQKTAFQTKKPKILVMPHGMLDPYFQKAPDRKLKAIRNWLYWALIEKHVVNNAAAVLFTCEKELLLARGIFNSYKPKIELNVGYGVSTPPVYDDSLANAFFDACPTLAEQPYILFLSRIHPKKGVDLLISAYIELSNNFTLPKLVVAGPGLDEEFGCSLVRKVAEAGFEDNILFPGMLFGNAKWGALHKCSAFILPSHQENFGIAVAEALSCGKAVLISDQVNISSEIIKASAGIVSKDDLDGVKDLLRKWTSLTEEQQFLMGENAHEAFNKYFNTNQTVKIFAQGLTKILESDL